MFIFCFRHGYVRYNEIINDPRFALINEPFKSEMGKSNFQDVKNRFLQRRYKLLEQALIIEEQLRRAANLQYGQQPPEKSPEKKPEERNGDSIQVIQNGGDVEMKEEEKPKPSDIAVSPELQKVQKNYTQIEVLVDANQNLARQALGGNRQAGIMIQKVLSQLEEILNDMKSDVSRLPASVAQLPSVCQRLEMNERA